MKKKRSSTPCLGICSTTFGDEVCKGCKRFSHEVVSWTKYSLEEREIVNNRLEKFKIKILKNRFKIIDKKLLAKLYVLMNLKNEILKSTTFPYYQYSTQTNKN